MYTPLYIVQWRLLLWKDSLRCRCASYRPYGRPPSGMPTSAMFQVDCLIYRNSSIYMASLLPKSCHHSSLWEHLWPIESIIDIKLYSGMAPRGTEKRRSAFERCNCCAAPTEGTSSWPPRCPKCVLYYHFTECNNYTKLNEGDLFCSLYFPSPKRISRRFLAGAGGEQLLTPHCHRYVVLFHRSGRLKGVCISLL